MKYNQFADTYSFGDGDLRNSYNGYINNTLRKHCTVEHGGLASLSAQVAKEKTDRGELRDTTSLSAYLDAGVFISVWFVIVA